MAIQIGMQCVYGIVPMQPIHGLPDGLMKVRLRHDKPAMVFVRHEHGTSCYHIEIHRGMWLAKIAGDNRVALRQAKIEERDRLIAKSAEFEWARHA